MTGYAFLTCELPRASLAAELKSVNSRFLDIQFRLPDEFRAGEPRLRELITSKVSRGKVECRMALLPMPDEAPRLGINAALVAALGAASTEIRGVIPDSQPLRVADVLRWPGVLRDDAAAGVSLVDEAVALLADALKEFSATRDREGEKLKMMLLERIGRMQTMLVQLQPLLPEAIAAYQEKLAVRFREALGSSDDERVRQEIALYGVKVDVTEELNRLGAHLQEVQRVLAAGGASGKRLDFLAQELNREANTLGAKMVSKEFSDASLEFKLLIEQMREQIQNIE